MLKKKSHPSKKKVKHNDEEMQHISSYEYEDGNLLDGCDADANTGTRCDVPVTMQEILSEQHTAMLIPKDRLQKPMLLGRSDYSMLGEAERFQGETVLLRTILVVLVLLFVTLAGAFVVSTSMMGLDLGGYERGSGTEEVLAVSSNRTSFNYAEQEDEMMVMQRLESFYINVSGTR